MRKLLCKLFNLITNEQYVADCARLAEQAEFSRAIAFDAGKAQAKVHWRAIPLPFTAEELAGGSYGDFITPAGFATVLGECSVPAPGPHGYEQRAYYVSKTPLLGMGSDLVCHNPAKFDAPTDSDELVPVIVTVLR